MKLWALVAANPTAFQAVFQTGLSAAIANVKTTTSSPQEPDYVYGIWKTGVQSWDAGLRAILNPLGYSVEVGGVYCHASTFVTWTPMQSSTKKSVEIGDLLVIARCTEPGPNGQLQSWNSAMLLQAKRSGWNSPLPSDDQFDLYHSVPSFTYTLRNQAKNSSAKSPLVGQSRNLGPIPHLGAQYHFIDEAFVGYRNPISDWAKDVSKTRNPDLPLAMELANLLQNTSGRPFPISRPAPARSDWDQVIWDLLDETARSYFTRRAMTGAGAAATTRGHLCLASGTSSMLKDVLASIEPSFRWSEANVPPSLSDFQEAEEDEPEGGLPILVIDLSLNQERRHT